MMVVWVVIIIIEEVGKVLLYVVYAMMVEFDY